MKVVSDGNGGVKIQESILEVIRKWATPALLGLLAYIGKLVVAEMIALHDGQFDLNHTIEKIAARTELLAAQTAENTAAIEETQRSVKEHDDWAKEQKAIIDRRIDKVEGHEYPEERR